MTQPPFGNYPPPPPGGFGDYPSFGPTLDVGEALNFGWSRFKENAGVWVGIVALFGAISILLSALGGGFDATTYDFRSSLFSLISVVVAWILQAAMVRGSLDEVDGRKPRFGDFFQLPNIGPILLTALFVSLLTALGFVLLIIPGLIVLFLSYFSTQFVVDKKLSAIDSIKSSWTVIAKNVGPLLLLALAVIGINVVGALLCGIGLLVSLPVTSIAVTHAYRAVSGNAVAGNKAFPA